ncbi:hypothetical protein N7491_007494 [Penicillium cf. griseofulvum]|uniref:Uncharacterized protein n=1 Tax=Penicillium cf. griseofulvum TaxID=2972120 RepID=A0A9W9IZF1_9EURO|nr:hypothetical protein N7472_009476 [Penicillium cf. griseofulvum]KAJ5430478.1 hypothetical protein N7491_007494 [Penicillium cf. griseofulvum]KAJ5435751.1 hypothetical protein N7445_006636 [Penicillium cf. griseofulvum]
MAKSKKDKEKAGSKDKKFTNKNAQCNLDIKPRGLNLPYYDKLRYAQNDKVITPPAEHRLSDALVFLIIGHNIVVA